MISGKDEEGLAMPGYAKRNVIPFPLHFPEESKRSQTLPSLS